MARRSPSLVADLVAAGHEVSGPRRRPPQHAAPRPACRAGATSRRATDAIADAAGVAPTWFRPPFGALSLGALRWRDAGPASRRCCGRRGGATGAAEATPTTVVGRRAAPLRRRRHGSAPRLRRRSRRRAPGAPRSARSRRSRSSVHAPGPRPSGRCATTASAPHGRARLSRDPRGRPRARAAGSATRSPSVVQQRGRRAAAAGAVALAAAHRRSSPDRPLWLVGIAVDIAAYGFEAAALGFGSVRRRRPAPRSGLLFALPFASFRTGRRVTRREMIPA